QFDGVSLAPQRQFATQDSALLVPVDRGEAAGLEDDERVAACVQEVTAAQVLVTFLVIAEYALRLYLDAAGAQLTGLWVIPKAAGSIEEQSQLLLVADMFGGEQNGKMFGIDLPVGRLRLREPRGQRQRNQQGSW